MQRNISLHVLWKVNSALVSEIGDDEIAEVVLAAR